MSFFTAIKPRERQQKRRRIRKHRADYYISESLSRTLYQKSREKFFFCSGFHSRLQFSGLLNPQSQTCLQLGPPEIDHRAEVGEVLTGFSISLQYVKMFYKVSGFFDDRHFKHCRDKKCVPLQKQGGKYELQSVDLLLTQSGYIGL